MNGDKLNVVRAWFKKAENDLINAEHTMKMEYPPCDMSSQPTMRRKISLRASYIPRNRLS